MGMLEHAIRDDLDKNAPRAMCVLSPLKVVLTTFAKDYKAELTMSAHPKDESLGQRVVPLTREIYIDKADFEEEPPAGFKRLVPGGEVRLRGAYVIRCDEVVKNDSGEIVQLNCSVDENTLGKSPEGRKVKDVIHWVSASEGVPATVRLYDRLFNEEKPEAKDVDYHNCLNPESLIKLENCVVEPSVIGNKAANFQFEREGYFCFDVKDSSDTHPVFNRTITLRDSWSN